MIMKKKYVNNLPNGKEVIGTEVSVEDGKLVVEIEFKEEFKPKDGDFCVTKNGCIFIYNENYKLISDYLGYYVGVDSCNGITINTDNRFGFSNDVRSATEKEKSAFLERLEKECNKKWNAEKKQLEDIRWRPKKGDKYFFIDCDGIIECTINLAAVDSFRIENNNCFKTEEAAQPYADKFKEILKNSKAE